MDQTLRSDDNFIEVQREFTPISLHYKEHNGRDWEPITVNFDTTNITTAWLVIVRFTSGGTFGTTHGYWRVEGVFATADSAYNMQKTIREGVYIASFSNPDTGEVIAELKNAWEGYYNSLDSVEVRQMEIDV